MARRLENPTQARSATHVQAVAFFPEGTRMAKKNKSKAANRVLALPQSALAGALAAAVVFSLSCSSIEKSGTSSTNGRPAEMQHVQAEQLRAVQDEEAGTISIFRENGSDPILTQNARPDHRPYLHPIVAPDGNGNVTQYSPGHHPHQTGLYWGFTRVNGEQVAQDTLKKWFYRKDKPQDIAQAIGRDFFHNPGGDYWRLKSAVVLTESGPEIKWQTVYDMLDDTGQAILTETQIWTMKSEGDRYLLDLEWTGEALTDFSVNEFDYGGMFLRMPWHKGINGEVVNAARQRGQQAEGKRSIWVDVGIQVEGRDDLAHVAMFDHPMNAGFPQTWRVDGQLGVGPVRARMGDWHIQKGSSESIRHRLVVYTGDLNDLELTEQWQDYTGAGAKGTAAMWGLAREEGMQEKFLTAKEAVDSMTMLEGFEANAWASEPMITQPMAFAWDDRGRMWVAENRDYETRKDGFSNSGDSRILILEDTDGDGVADSRKVFVEGISFPSAIAIGFDGLFLAAPPNLLFIPDRDGDDRGDMEDVEILLTGWGIRDRHETINSLHWGPDGWLYGLEGFATPSKIRKPNGDARLYGHKEPFPEDLLEADGVDINGGVWRYHPTKKRFEVVGHGFSNPWGIDYDAKGQLFISACVIPHVFHVVPGGIYHRQGGQHFNPYVYGDIRTIVDHRHRSAHGGARVYLSDAFPQEHHGRLFMANIHEHAVLTDVLESKGSGYVASHGDDFLYANNAQWVGFSMEIGPAGDVYVLDWHDASICGDEVHHKDTGMIFRVTPKQSLAEDWPGRYSDLSTMSSPVLVELQLSKSAWHARRARVILQNRAAKGELDRAVYQRLQEIFQGNENSDIRLRAMWTLHITGGFTADALTEALADADPHVRAWAIQMLCEDDSPPANALARFAQMAQQDTSPVVRLYLAAALQRLQHDERWPIAEALVQHSEDKDDHNIPKMLWFAIEPLVAEDPERGIELAHDSEIPLLVEYTARRLVDAEELEILVGTLDKRINRGSDKRLSFLTGMLNGLEGHYNIAPPSNWSSVYAKLERDESLAETATLVAQQFGGNEVTGQFLATLTDRQSPLEARQQAIHGLAGQQWPELADLIPDLMDEEPLRIAAIRAVAAFENKDLGRLLLNRYDEFSSAEKVAAIETLASRSSYGGILMYALENEMIPKSDVPAYAARKMHRVVGSGFLEVWGPITALSSEKQATIAKFKTLLTPEVVAAADPVRGERMFDEACGICHQMYGEGGLLGPDLTGSNRTELDYLLTNIVDPNGDIQDAYKMVLLTTRDGRTYAGNVIAESDRDLTLRIVGDESVVISKSEIQSRDRSEISMMPEGMLKAYTNPQIVDLIGYLMNTTNSRSHISP